MDMGSNSAASLILNWKIGFEIELVAPPGVTRQDLARQVAKARGASVHTFFHPQSELSEVPGKPVFENLTPGFAVVAPDGAPFAAFVDDLTLQADLRHNAPPVAGWYRIVADDPRLLRLVMRHCDPSAQLDYVLEPLASLFGTEQQPHESGMMRVTDDRGVSVAICAPLPGERERTCEIITAPIEEDHGAVLSELLSHARSIGFTVPREGATHLHFDADRLCSAPVIARLVQLFDAHRDALRTLVGVNTNAVVGRDDSARCRANRRGKFRSLPRFALQLLRCQAARRRVGLRSLPRKDGGRLQGHPQPRKQSRGSARGEPHEGQYMQLGGYRANAAGCPNAGKCLGDLGQ